MLRYTIQELAKTLEISRRTIRYYIQRGLLDPPRGSGRGSYYDETHLMRLRYIRDAQLKGIPLAQIDTHTHSDNTTVSSSSDTVSFDSELDVSSGPWTRVTLGPGLELHLSNREISHEHLQTIQKTLNILFPLKKESST